MNGVSVQTMPADLDAERSVLGAMLLANAAIDIVDLRAEDFHDVQHELIFRGITEAWQSGHRAIDPVTLASQLEQRGELEEAGGAENLFRILEAVPHAQHVRLYAATVQQKSKLRRLITLARNTGAAASASGANPDQILADLERDGLAIQEQSTAGEFVTMDDAVVALEEREANPAAVHKTGLADVDRQLNGGGLADGQLCVLGGRPGAGKSILATQIAVEFAKRGEPTLLISLEMPRAEIAHRLSQSIRRHQLRQLPIQIVDRGGELNRISSQIRLAHRRDSIQLVVVDYLQLVTGGSQRDSRERQVADVSRTLKRLAMELDMPVVAACQLNRAAESEKRKPRLSDLRESGAIEQDADIVGLLHRTEAESELIIAKQRNGSPGIVRLAFQPERFRFENAALYDGGL